MKETSSGTSMYMGTSNSYATGITNNAVIIDQIGRVTKPVQPAFTAHYNGAISAPATIVWGTALDNVGGCYNTTTGMFTAPVTGFYVFGYNILLPNASTGEYRLNFYKNGSLFDGIIYVKPAAGWYTLGSTVMLRLTAGDTMSIYYEQGSGALYNDVNYNKFWGYLLG